MFFILVVFTFMYGILDSSVSWIISSGLFAIASAIEQASYKYFKNK